MNIKTIHDNLGKTVITQTAAQYKEALTELEQCQSRVKKLEEFFGGGELVKYSDEPGDAIVARVKDEIQREKEKRENSRARRGRNAQ